MTSVCPQDIETAGQRKLERLIAWTFMVLGIGSLAVIAFDNSSSLATPWDYYVIPINSLLYLLSGLIGYFRPKWLAPAVLLSVIPSAVYHQGVFYWAICYPDGVSYYSAASSGPFFPMIYVVLFIALPAQATRISVIHCAVFYVQYLLHQTVWAIAPPSPGRLEAEHLLVSVLLAHPIYIVSLRYIVRLREQLNQTRQEAFQSKADFLAMLSHEIRNLLQTMVSAIGLLELRVKDPNCRKPLDRLMAAAAQLQTYLQDAAELTKLENPAVGVESKLVNVDELLLEVSEAWSSRALERGLNLEVKLQEGEPPKVQTDRKRLSQILGNLISNALKYTERGGITLEAHADFGEVLITVSDTGIGIAPDCLEKIFEPYIRLDTPQGRRSEGSGLGLTIVRKLVTSLGGHLGVESQLGEGSRFYFSLPKG